jgi:hypothetical protein
MIPNRKEVALLRQARLPPHMFSARPGTVRIRTPNARRAAGELPGVRPGAPDDHRAPGRTEMCE